MSDILDYDLDVPDKPMIQRMGNEMVFPFGKIKGRRRIETPVQWINDTDVKTFGSLSKIAEISDGKMLYTNASFTAYPLIKPYENLVREIYKDLILPKRKDNSIILMLRDSNHDKGFRLPTEYYLNILENETFDNVFISCDHTDNHEHLMTSLKKYNPKYLHNLNVLDLFKEITSFNKIVASQGTFSFWASWLSNADKIYWPETNLGPNSYHKKPENYFDVNLYVENDNRYEFIDIQDIFKT